MLSGKQSPITSGKSRCILLPCVNWNPSQLHLNLICLDTHPDPTGPCSCCLSYNFLWSGMTQHNSCIVNNLSLFSNWLIYVFCFVLSCAAPVGAKFREGERWNDIQGPLGRTGHYWGWTEGKSRQNTAVLFLDPCPTFKTHTCASEQTHTHTHRQTPIATLHPVPDSFLVEFWPWLCAANSQHMEGVFFEKVNPFWHWNTHTCTHSLKQTMKLSLYYTYTHINSLPATTPL